VGGEGRGRAFRRGGARGGRRVDDDRLRPGREMGWSAVCCRGLLAGAIAAIAGISLSL
jgi:hypothetical protein